MPTLQNIYFFHINLMGKTYSLESDHGNMLIQCKLTQICGMDLG